MIDAHLHVWDRTRSRYRWLDGAPEPLRADHTLDQAFAALVPHGFDRAVLVQADETLEETAFLLELLESDPRLAGAVGYLPLEAPDVVADRLRELAGRGLVGVRNLTHDRPDPDWLLGSDQRRSLESIEAAGLPLDYLAVLPRHLENLVTLAREHTGLTFVLDHLGTPPVPDGDYRRWEDQLAEVAANPNVVAKVSGIYGTGGGAASREQMRRVLASALATFGHERLMLGSDWPVCTVPDSADATLGRLLAAVAGLPAEQVQALRGGTAMRVYSLA